MFLKWAHNFVILRFLSISESFYSLITNIYLLSYCYPNNCPQCGCYSAMEIYPTSIKTGDSNNRTVTLIRPQRTMNNISSGILLLCANIQNNLFTQHNSRDISRQS